MTKCTNYTCSRQQTETTISRQLTATFCKTITFLVATLVTSQAMSHLQDGITDVQGALILNG